MLWRVLELAIVPFPGDRASFFRGNCEMSQQDANDSIPDENTQREVLDSDGKEHSFSSLFEGVPEPKTLIIFVRHFLCHQCFDYVKMLVEKFPPTTPFKKEFIGCGEPKMIEKYKKDTGCTWPMYANPDKSIYAAFGMVRTLKKGDTEEWQTTSLTSGIWRAVKLAGNLTSAGDWKQNGGEVLYDNQGKCLWAHLMTTTTDHAGEDELKKVRESVLEDLKDEGTRSVFQ
ncbi:hypothetical protein PROFUN_06813 [Planoprotostelium fungivorum]|uniref:Thioredoxin-like fold domain-containing protein n=1 Tax=Planoprotostelium fungivorum TaxID=1890364 RepID=A0A2P6NN94_9EUKA|nr:hypothetical protein PROFUN_06813 [Planoprotostelium fungivorum]